MAKCCSVLLGNPERDSSWQFRQRRHPLNVPREMMNGVGRGQNGRAARCKGQAHQTRPGDFQRCFALWGYLDDAALAIERCRDLKVAVHVEGQSLRTSQAPVKRGNGAMRIDLVYAIEAGGRGPGYKEIPVRTKSQVVGGDAGLEGCEDENLAVGCDLENGATAVADIDVCRAVEGDASGDAHAFGV